MKIILNPWQKEFSTMAHSCANSLILVSPYIQPSIVKSISSAMKREGARPISIQVLTRLDVADFVAGVSSIEALRLLLNHGAEVRACSNLHAKIYVFDGQKAIVTSANATGQGIAKDKGNLEFGLLFTESEEVNNTVLNIQTWSQQSLVVTQGLLDDVQKVVDELKSERDEFARIQRRMKTKILAANIPKAPKISAYTSMPVKPPKPPKPPKTIEPITLRPEKIKFAALTSICAGKEFEALKNAKYLCANKVVHVRYTKHQNSDKYWFNINQNMLSADYNLFICGSPNEYYLLPNKVLHKLYEVSKVDKTHEDQGIRWFNIHLDIHEFKSTKESVAVDARKYFRKKLPSTR